MQYLLFPLSRGHFGLPDQFNQDPLRFRNTELHETWCRSSGAEDKGSSKLSTGCVGKSGDKWKGLGHETELRYFDKNAKLWVEIRASTLTMSLWWAAVVFATFSAVEVNTYERIYINRSPLPNYFAALLVSCWFNWTNSWFLLVHCSSCKINLLLWLDVLSKPIRGPHRNVKNLARTSNMVLSVYRNLLESG